MSPPAYLKLDNMKTVTNQIQSQIQTVTAKVTALKTSTSMIVMSKGPTMTIAQKQTHILTSTLQPSDAATNFFKFWTLNH